MNLIDAIAAKFKNNTVKLGSVSSVFEALAKAKVMSVRRFVCPCGFLQAILLNGYVNFDRAWVNAKEFSHSIHFRKYAVGPVSSAGPTIANCPRCHTAVGFHDGDPYIVPGYSFKDAPFRIEPIKYEDDDGDFTFLPDPRRQYDVLEFLPLMRKTESTEDVSEKEPEEEPEDEPEDEKDAPLEWFD